MAERIPPPRARSRGGLPGLLRREPLRQALVSVLLVFTLFAVITELTFDSALRRNVTKVTGPYVQATGLDQGWGVFAPEPRPSSLGWRARITYADGTAEWWRFPKGGPVVGEYWDYRWRKYLEYVLGAPWKVPLWEPLATWVARNHAAGGRRPVKVVFVSNWRDNFAPGKRPLESEPRSIAYYTLRITPEMLKGAQ